jgi:hypothetical protein
MQCLVQDSTLLSDQLLQSLVFAGYPAPAVQWGGFNAQSSHGRMASCCTEFPPIRLVLAEVLAWVQATLFVK